MCVCEKKNAYRTENRTVKKKLLTYFPITITYFRKCTSILHSKRKNRKRELFVLLLLSLLKIKYSVCNFFFPSLCQVCDNVEKLFF